MTKDIANEGKFQVSLDDLVFDATEQPLSSDVVYPIKEKDRTSPPCPSQSPSKSGE